MCRYEHRFDIHIFFKQMVIKTFIQEVCINKLYTCICPYIYTLYILINIIDLIIKYKHEDAGI